MNLKSVDPLIEKVKDMGIHVFMILTCTIGMQLVNIDLISSIFGDTCIRDGFLWYSVKQLKQKIQWSDVCQNSQLKVRI